jgi:hypothetical protein
MTPLHSWFQSLSHLKAVLAAPQLIERAVGLRRQHLTEMLSGHRPIAEWQIRDIEMAYALPAGLLDEEQPLVLCREEVRRSQLRRRWLRALFQRIPSTRIAPQLGLGFRTCCNLAYQGLYVSAVIPKMLAESTGEALPPELAEPAPDAARLIHAFSGAARPRVRERPRRREVRWRELVESPVARQLALRGELEEAKRWFERVGLDPGSREQTAFLYETRRNARLELVGRRHGRDPLRAWLDDCAARQYAREQARRLRLERYFAIRTVVAAQRPEQIVDAELPAQPAPWSLCGSSRKGWWLDLGAEGVIGLTEEQRLTLAAVRSDGGSRSYPHGVGVVQGEAEGQWLLLSSNHAGAVQEARLTAEQLADAATLAAGRIDRRIAA